MDSFGILYPNIFGTQGVLVGAMGATFADLDGNGIYVFTIPTCRYCIIHDIAFAGDNRMLSSPACIFNESSVIAIIKEAIGNYDLSFRIYITMNSTKLQLSTSRKAQTLFLSVLCFN